MTEYAPPKTREYASDITQFMRTYCKKKISEGEQTNTLNRFNFKNMFPEANNSPKAKTVSFEEQIIF